MHNNSISEPSKLIIIFFISRPSLLFLCNYLQCLKLLELHFTWLTQSMYQRCENFKQRQNEALLTLTTNGKIYTTTGGI